MSDGSGSSGLRRSQGQEGGSDVKGKDTIKFREQTDSNAKVLRYVTDFLMNHSGKWIGLDKLNHNPKLVGFIGHLLVGLPGIHRTMNVRTADGTEKEIGYLGTEWIAQTFNIRDWGGIPMVPREIITVTKDAAGEVLVKLTANWTTTRTGSKLIVVGIQIPHHRMLLLDASTGTISHQVMREGGEAGIKGEEEDGGREVEEERQLGKEEVEAVIAVIIMVATIVMVAVVVDSMMTNGGTKRTRDRPRPHIGMEREEQKHESPAVDWDDDDALVKKEGDISNGEGRRHSPEPKRQRTLRSPSPRRRTSSRSRGKSNANDHRGRSKSGADRRGYPGPRSRSSSESSIELSDAESWPEDPTDDRENRNNISVDSNVEVAAPLKQAKAIADDLQLFELGSERKQRDMRDMLREMIRDLYQIYRPEKSSHVHSRLFRKFSGREDLLYLLVAERYVGRPTYHERRRRRIKYRPRDEHKGVKQATEKQLVSGSVSRSTSNTPTASQRNGMDRESSGPEAMPRGGVTPVDEGAIAAALPVALPLNVRITPEVMKYLTRTRSWLQKAVESLVPKIVLFDEASANPLDIRVLHVLTNCCFIKFRPERSPHKIIGCLAGYERCIPTNLPQGKSVTSMNIPKTNALLLKTVLRDPSTGQTSKGEVAFRAVSNEPATIGELEAAASNWQSISSTVNTKVEDIRRCERALKLIHQRQAPLSKESVRRIVLNGEMLTVDTLPPNEGRPASSSHRHHRPPPASTTTTTGVAPIMLGEEDREKAKEMETRLPSEPAKHINEYLVAEDISGQIVALRALAEAAPADDGVFWLLHRQLTGMPTHPWRKHLARTCENMKATGKEGIIREWYDEDLVTEAVELKVFLDQNNTPPIPSRAIQFVRQIELALEYPFTKNLYDDHIGKASIELMELLIGRYAARLDKEAAVGPSGEQSDWCLTTFRTYLQSLLVLSAKCISTTTPGDYLNAENVCHPCLVITLSTQAPPDLTTQAALVLAHAMDGKDREALLDHITAGKAGGTSPLSLMEGGLTIPAQQDMPLSARLAVSRGLLVAATGDDARLEYTEKCVEFYTALLLDRHAALDTPTLLYGLQSLMVLVSRGAEGPLMETQRIRDMLEACVTHWEHPSNLVHQLCEQLFEILCRKAGASGETKLNIVKESVKELPFCRAKCKGLSFLLPLSGDDAMAIALDMVPDLLDTVSQEGSSSSAAKQLLEKVCSMAPGIAEKFDLKGRLFSPILDLLNRIHQSEGSDLNQGLADTLTNILSKAPTELLVSLWDAALNSVDAGGDYSILALAGLFRKLGRAEFTEAGLTLVEPKAKRSRHGQRSSEKPSPDTAPNFGKYGSFPLARLEGWMLSADSAMAISTLKLLSTVKSPATTPLTAAEVRLVYPLFIRDGQQLKLSDLSLRQRATSALKAFLQRLRDTWDLKQPKEDGTEVASKRFAPWLKALFLDYLVPVATRPGSPLEIAYPAAVIIEHVYKLFGSLPVSLNTGKAYSGCSIAKELGFYEPEVVLSLFQALGAPWSKQRAAVVQALQAIPSDIILQVGPQIERRIAELARKSKQVVRVRWTSEAAALSELYSQSLNGDDRVAYVETIIVKVREEFEQSIGKGLDALRGLHLYLACLAAALPYVRGIQKASGTSLVSVTAIELLLSICVSVLGAISEGVDDVLVSSNLLTAAGLDHAACRPKTSVDCRGHLIVSEPESSESDELMDTSDDASMDIDDGASTTTSSWTTIKESISALEAIVENLPSMESIASPRPDERGGVSLVTLASSSAVEVWDKVVSMLLLFLLSTKHPGAITRLYQCLAEVTRRLLLAEDSELQRLPQKWLDDLHSLLTDHAIVQEDSQERSRLRMVLPPALRRSFGLGLCFVGILEGSASHVRLAGGGYASCQMLLDTIARLEGVFDGPSADDVTSCVHALNVLRAVVRDAHLAGYIPESVMNSVLLLAVKTLSQRGEETWPIRSAGTLLFVHASRRVLGNDSEHTVASGGRKHTGRATTFMELCRRQPQLIDAITSLLRDTTDDSTVMPALLFVCKLKLGNEEAVAQQQHKELLDAIWELARSPIWHVRKLASVALVNLGAVENVADALLLQPKSANEMHVKLESLKFLVKSGCGDELRAEDLSSLLAATSTCPPLNSIVLDIARLCHIELSAGPCDPGDGFLGIQRSKAAAMVSNEVVENCEHPQVLEALIKSRHASEGLISKALSVDIHSRPEYRGAALAALTVASADLLTDEVVERLHALLYPNDVDGVLSLAKSSATSTHRREWLELCCQSSQPAEVRVAAATLVPDDIALTMVQDECEEVRCIVCKKLGGLAPLPTLCRRPTNRTLTVPTASEVSALIADRAAPRSFDKEEPNTYREELLSTQLAFPIGVPIGQGSRLCFPTL
ncbi:hypothetical protein FOL47_006586 [Perkinsus chesapeaki]|uniref:Uncharacterized protein n=1 Tax=Perkinsus chesapeaki TaxID=330153 RepID=A0A7J6MX77_PERCH|nr:hypothetical protein FOL47_006586 [Perkinsus chesapeaki]